VRGVDMGIRGKEGVRIGRESTILCQFLLRLVSLSLLLSSSVLSARSRGACATAILLYREERDERGTNYNVSEEESLATETSP